jgi:hypothetical protein
MKPVLQSNYLAISGIITRYLILYIGSNTMKLWIIGVNEST